MANQQIQMVVVQRLEAGEVLQEVVLPLALGPVQLALARLDTPITSTIGLRTLTVPLQCRLLL